MSEAKTKHADMPYAKLAAREVEWYRRHGRYPKSRIVRASDGVEYVIGDWSWNRKNPLRQEWVESQMSSSVTRPES